MSPTVAVDRSPRRPPCWAPGCWPSPVPDAGRLAPSVRADGTARRSRSGFDAAGAATLALGAVARRTAVGGTVDLARLRRGRRRRRARASLSVAVAGGPPLESNDVAPVGPRWSRRTRRASANDGNERVLAHAQRPGYSRRQPRAAGRGFGGLAELTSLLLPVRRARPRRRRGSSPGAISPASVERGQVSRRHRARSCPGHAAARPPVATTRAGGLHGPRTRERRPASRRRHAPACPRVAAAPGGQSPRSWLASVLVVPLRSSRGRSASGRWAGDARLRSRRSCSASPVRDAGAGAAAAGCRRGRAAVLLNPQKKRFKPVRGGRLRLAQQAARPPAPAGCTAPSPPLPARRPASSTPSCSVVHVRRDLLLAISARSSRRAARWPRDAK